MAKRGIITAAYFEGKTINTAKITAIPLGKKHKGSANEKGIKGKFRTN